MYTGRFEVKPNINGVFTADGVYTADHSSSTVEITLEFANDKEVAALFNQFMVPAQKKPGPITPGEVAEVIHK